MTKVIDQVISEKWAVYMGDSVELIKGIPDSKIHYSIFSPPFSSLYTYSASDRDIGNCKGENEFFKHFSYLIKDLFRITISGRLVSVHCIDIPRQKEKDGFIGLYDFSGDLIRWFEKEGFIYHSKVTIWKDPLLAAVRTRALGLAHKQLVKDSAMCTQGQPDYVITFRKPGVNTEPISHGIGFDDYIGTEILPKVKKTDNPATNKKSHIIWQRYASPVWFDINQSNTLNFVLAREQNDERHICPLQLDVIARCLELWSNPGDIVFSPFMGIGSEGYESLKRGRKFIGMELKKSYFDIAVKNLKSIEFKKQLKGFFNIG
jgi:DNA modification methylase